MFPSFIIHAKLIGNLILIKYLMMDVSLVESVDIDKILMGVLLCICLQMQFKKEHLCTNQLEKLEAAKAA